MVDTWYRSGASLFDPWDGSHTLIASLLPGNTLLRLHFGISLIAWVTPQALDNQFDLTVEVQQGCCVGIITTIGDTTEAVPFATAPVSDAARPTQRWLYWRTIYPRWRDSMIFVGQTQALDYADLAEELDTHAQVVAPAMAPGQTLNVWLRTNSIYAAPWTTTAGTDIGRGAAWWGALVRS
jgi:hypothetical protein